MVAEHSIVLWNPVDKSNSYAFKGIITIICAIFVVIPLRRFIKGLIIQFKKVQKAFEDIKRIFEIIDQLKCDNEVQGFAIKKTEEQLLSLGNDLVKDLNNDLKEHKTDLFQTITDAISTYLQNVSLEIQELRFQLEQYKKLIQEFDSKIESRAGEVMWESGIILRGVSNCYSVTANSDFIVVFARLNTKNGVVQLFNKSNSKKVYEFELKDVVINGQDYPIGGDRPIAVDQERLYVFEGNKPCIVILGLKDGCLIHHIPVKNPTSVYVNESNIYVPCHHPHCVKVFDKGNFSEVFTFDSENGELMDCVAFDESRMYLVYQNNQHSKLMIYNSDKFTFIKSWDISFVCSHKVSVQSYSKHIYLSNYTDCSISVFDKENGNVIKKIGGPWSSTNIKCCFGMAVVIGCDSKNNTKYIYVLDSRPYKYGSDKNPIIKRVKLEGY